MSAMTTGGGCVSPDGDWSLDDPFLTFDTGEPKLQLPKEPDAKKVHNEY